MTCLFGSRLNRSRIGCAVLVRHLAVVQQRAELAQRLGQRLQRLDPLREDDGLAAALRHLGHVGLQLLQLGALPGPRVEVADLLQAHHQLEDVLHGDGVAQRVEVDDALLLGQVVGLALLRRQLREGVADRCAAACRWPPPPWCAAGCSRASAPAAAWPASPAGCGRDRRTQRCSPDRRCGSRSACRSWPSCGRGAGRAPPGPSSSRGS